VLFFFLSVLHLISIPILQLIYKGDGWCFYYSAYHCILYCQLNILWYYSDAALHGLVIYLTISSHTDTHTHTHTHTHNGKEMETYAALHGLVI
jgi:hypothetical protein